MFGECVVLALGITHWTWWLSIQKQPSPWGTAAVSEVTAVRSLLYKLSWTVSLFKRAHSPACILRNRWWNMLTVSYQFCWKWTSTQNYLKMNFWLICWPWRWPMSCVREWKWQGEWELSHIMFEGNGPLLNLLLNFCLVSFYSVKTRKQMCQKSSNVI